MEVKKRQGSSKEEIDVANWYRGKTFPHDGTDPIVSAVLYGMGWKQNQYENYTEDHRKDWIEACEEVENISESAAEKYILAKTYLRGMRVGLGKGHAVGSMDAIKTNELCRDEYVLNVGTWKIIQRLEENIERQKESISTLKEAVLQAEDSFKYLADKNLFWGFKLAFRDFATCCANNCRKALKLAEDIL